MTQIIAAIVGAVALVVLCECCYALGKIEGRRKGFKEGLHTFEELHKDMVAAEVSAQAKQVREEGYKEGYDAGIKSVKDIIDEADKVITDLVGDDDICEDMIVGALSGGVSSEVAAEDDSDDSDREEFTGGQIIGPLSERVSDKSEYDCKRCVFAETPYCEKCNVIKLAGGGEGKPSRFIKVSDGFCYIDAPNIPKERNTIALAVAKHHTIPIKTVVEYNQNAERRNKK